MRRTDTTLADGRRLHYYRDDAEADAPADTRPLEPNRSAGSMRFDALDDEWVTIAAHRQSRTFLPSTVDCPLCPSTPDHATEIPASDFEVVVFENRFPSFSAPPDDFDVPIGAIGEATTSAGRCEVICFSADHDTSFAQLPPDRVRLILDAWADRTEELMQAPHVQQVFAFENCGEEIGVTIRHPHGQIYAYPFVTPRTTHRLRTAATYFDTHGRELIADLIAREEADEERIVRTSDHWIAFVPFAARWPFHVQLHPRRDARALYELDDAARNDLAVVYSDLVRRFDGLFGIRMPYIAAWHQAPKGPLAAHARLYLELFSNRRAPDKLKYLAGSEAAMGAFVNDIRPEDAARLLREAGARVLAT